MGEGNNHPSPGNPEIPKQDKPKMKQPKTHINQINKDKTRRTNIKSSKGKKQITHKRIPIRITADLSIKTLQARREWQGILKVMKENNLQPRFLYPARISFKYEAEIKSFTDKQKLREFNPLTFKVILDKYDPIAIYFIVLGSSLYTLSVFPV